MFRFQRHPPEEERRVLEKGRAVGQGTVQDGRGEAQREDVRDRRFG